MTDEDPSRPTKDIARTLIQTIPGWALIGVVLFIVTTRDQVSETLVGTLLGFALVLLGVPFVLPGRKP